MKVHKKRRSVWSAGFRLFTIGILAVSFLISAVNVAPASAVAGVPTRLTSGGAATSFLPTEFVEMGGSAYFLLQDATNGVALWKSDGTAAGTVLVKTISTITSNMSLTKVGSTLYIIGAVSGSDGDLWKSDGTEAGTVLVKSNLSFSIVERFRPLNLNGTFYFGVTDTTIDSTELWTSDGTEAGTVKVTDLGQALGKMVVLDGIMYFPDPNNAPNDPGYWKSDGTAAGTSLILIEDLFPSMVDASTSLGSFTVADDAIFYWINGDVASALVKVTSIPQSDTVVKDKLKNSREPIAIDGVLYFFGWTYDTDPNTIADPGLWTSDGTEAGTEFIASSFFYTPSEEPQPTLGEISSFGNYDGQLMIFAWKIDYNEEGYGNPIGMELWSSDGTSAGTDKIKDILAASPADTGTRSELNGLFYFAATSEDEGFELWETDGTTAGTDVIDLNPGPGYGMPGGLNVIDGKLFFWGYDDTEGFRPWMLTNGV